MSQETQPAEALFLYHARHEINSYRTTHSIEWMARSIDNIVKYLELISHIATYPVSSVATPGPATRHSELCMEIGAALVESLGATQTHDLAEAILGYSRSHRFTLPGLGIDKTISSILGLTLTWHGESGKRTDGDSGDADRIEYLADEINKGHTMNEY